MLDQVYNAINILKPFGTHLILLLSLYFSLFLYLLIFIYLFLPWPVLCYQISQVSINPQPTQWQVGVTLVQVKGGLDLVVKITVMVDLAILRFMVGLGDHRRLFQPKWFDEMETSSINVYHMLIILDQVLWETKNEEIWTKCSPEGSVLSTAGIISSDLTHLMQPEAHLNLQDTLVSIVLDKGRTKNDRSPHAQSWRGCSDCRSSGTVTALMFVQPKHAERASLVATCGTDPVLLSTFGFASLPVSSHLSCFAFHMLEIMDAFQERCWGHKTLITPRFLEGKRRFFPRVSLSNWLPPCHSCFSVLPNCFP